MGVSKAHVIMGVKVALGAAAAIGLAMLLHLEYSATAGIITVLSIMGTKRETLRIARGRLLAVLCAAGIAFVCYRLLGYTLAGFAAYLFLFALLCYTCRWAYAIPMASVLVSHFLAAGNMGWPMLVNEALLFLIGTGSGVLVNLHLRPDAEAMRCHLRTVDELMRASMHALSRMAEGVSEARLLMAALGGELTQAEQLAVDNADNTFGSAPLYPVRYVQMRANQLKILRQIAAALADVDLQTPQCREVCALLARVAEEYSRENDVSALLEEVKAVLADMRAQALPVTRKEFESRAVLYYVLLRVEDFLLLKRQFYEENANGTDNDVFG